jgi:hypothetical protein
VGQLHADCFFYQNHWQPKEEKKRWRKKRSEEIKIDDIPFLNSEFWINGEATK